MRNISNTSNFVLRNLLYLSVNQLFRNTKYHFVDANKKIMDADIEGALAQIDRSWRVFEHKGKPMTKEQVKAVLEFGLAQGYGRVSEILDSDIDRIISELK